MSNNIYIDGIKFGIALKPCPFCGGAAELVKAKKHKQFPWYVECVNAVLCGNRTARWNGRAGAVNAWNRRASDG